MVGTITDLQIQKRNKERVSVYLDGTYAFAVTIFVAAGLKKGQLLSEDDIEQLKDQDERNRGLYGFIKKFIYFC